MATSKTNNIIYWVLLVLFAAFMLMDGIGGVTHAEEGIKSMKTLGYPVYVMTILGVAKILGVIVLLQPKFPILKEWAYAGFTFNFIGAAISWAFVGGPALFILIPLVMLAIMACIYALWKKRIA